MCRHTVSCLLSVNSVSFPMGHVYSGITRLAKLMWFRFLSRFDSLTKENECPGPFDQPMFVQCHATDVLKRVIQ